MFPGAGAEIYRNEAGEPIGWDYPSHDDPYDPDDYLPGDEEDDEDECPHASVDEKAGPPDPTGRCRTYAVCEDCGEELGEVGWDSVL